MSESVHATIERQINDVTATERPQGARVVWRSEALKIAEQAYATGFSEGQRHGYDIAQADAQDEIRKAFEVGRRYAASRRLYDWRDCQHAGHPIVQTGLSVLTDAAVPVGLCWCEEVSDGDAPMPSQVNASLDLLEAARTGEAG